MNNREDIWSAILSCDEQEIIEVLELLSEEEKKYVISHLQRMVSEDGWHPSQIESASYALQVFENII